MQVIKLFDNNIENIVTILERHKRKDLSQYRIEISKQIALNKSLLEYICKSVPNDVLCVNYSDNNIELYDEEETKVLTKNVNYIRKNYKKNVEFSNGYSIEKAIEASRKINKWVKIISEVKEDGTKLSPFEKYLCAYQYVTNFEYKEGGKYDSRDLIAVLTGDKIVCVGFSSMLKELCNRLGIPCARQSIKWKDENGEMHYHMNNVVLLKDEKYGINGIYYVDSCWDSYSSKSNNSFLIYSCMKYSDVEKIFPYFQFLTGDNEIVSNIYNEEYQNIGAKYIQEIKNIQDETADYFKDNKNYYVEIFDDIVCDNLWDDKLKFTKVKLDMVGLAKGIEKLCDEMYKDIFLIQHSRPETINYLRYIFSGMHNYGFSKEQIHDILLKTAKNSEPKKSLLVEYISHVEETSKKLSDKLSKIDDESKQIMSNYNVRKKNASTISEGTFYEALKKIGHFYGLDEKECQAFARRKIDVSIIKASRIDDFDRNDLDNSIVNIANATRGSSTSSTKKKHGKEKNDN